MSIRFGCRNLDIFGRLCIESGESSATLVNFWCFGLTMLPFGDTRVKEGEKDEEDSICAVLLLVVSFSTFPFLACLFARRMDIGTTSGAETASLRACASAATGDDSRLVCLGDGVFGTNSASCCWRTRSRSRCLCCFSLSFFFSATSLPRGFFIPPRARITSCPLLVFGLYKLLAAMTTPAMFARQMQRLQKSAGRAGIPVDSGVAIASRGMLLEESFEEPPLLLPAL